MNSETIVYCVVALILGMLLANMLKSVCGCKVVEGQDEEYTNWMSELDSKGAKNCLDEVCGPAEGTQYCNIARRSHAEGTLPTSVYDRIVSLDWCGCGKEAKTGYCVFDRSPMPL